MAEDDRFERMREKTIIFCGLSLSEEIESNIWKRHANESTATDSFLIRRSKISKRNSQHFAGFETKDNTD